MITERDWYGIDWKILRSQLVKLCLRNSKTLLKSLSIEPASHTAILIEDYMKQVRIDIRKRVKLDQLGLWQNCLPLLIQTERLCSEIEKDREALCGRKKHNGKPILPHQALGRKLIQFFEMNRREHIANDMGVSSNKVKTWERLDRISRKMAKNDRPANRCTENHFEELSRYVKDNHGHDKNLPRRAITVKGYFYRFSKDCIEKIEDRDDMMDKLSLQETKELFQGVGLPELSICLEQLSVEEFEIIDVAFRLGMSKVVYRSVSDYLHNHQIKKKKFKQYRNQVIDKLRECLEISLISGRGGY